MKKTVVNVSRAEEYDVLIGYDIAQDARKLLPSAWPEKSIFLIDENVYGLYEHTLFSNLPKEKRNEIIIPAGEKYKNFETYKSVVDELSRKDTYRRSSLILIGGGLVMDLGGFVGATFMRGIPVINVPTTLIAQIDAAIGGKVAINHPSAKNLVGAFHNPQKVIVDPRFLSTLDVVQMREGLAEIIKVAIIHSSRLFCLLDENLSKIFTLDKVLIEEMISLAIQSKADLLRPDPLELNLERVLNFGHTLAHPIETIKHYQEISHGYAVAIGMATASRFALKKEICSQETYSQIMNLLEQANLPTKLTGFDYDELYKAVQTVIRIRNGHINLVVPSEIGKPIILKDVSVEELLDCIM